MTGNKKPKRESFHNNRIDLPFGQAVDRLLAAKPKKRPARKKKAAGK